MMMRSYIHRQTMQSVIDNGLQANIDDDVSNDVKSVDSSVIAADGGNRKRRSARNHGKAKPDCAENSYWKALGFMGAHDTRQFDKGPLNSHEAYNSPYSAEWEEAKRAEYKALSENGVFDFFKRSSLPPNTGITNLTMIFLHTQAAYISVY